jgi:uncharacterized protein YneF (UPF0154 family)
MKIPFKVLFQRSTLLKYGTLGCLAGVGMIAFGLYSDNTMPARANLQKVEGRITEAVEKTRKGRRSGTTVTYELTIAGSGGQPVKLTIPQREISRSQVEAIMPTAVSAEFDAENDVYVLTSNGRPVITYEKAVESRQSTNRFLEGMGAILFAVAGLLAGLGYWLAKRKITKEIAEWEAANAQQQQMQPSTAGQG